MKDARLAYDALTRTLIRRSTMIIALLASLALGSLVIFWVQTRNIESAAGVLNVSGRQRMLSQRTALMADCWVRSQDSEEGRACREQLLDLAGQMEVAHRGLVEGDPSLRLPSTDAAQVLHLYFEGEGGLDGQVRDYLEALRALAASPNPQSSDANFVKVQQIAQRGELLRSFDGVVNTLQGLEEEKVARLQRLQSIVFGLTLIAIVIMQRRVVQPMGQRVSRHLNELASREESLRRQREQLRLTLENAPVGIASCDLEGRMVSVNQTLCQVLSAEEDDLVGQRYLDFAHPSSVEANESLLRAASEGRLKVFARDQRFLRRDGATLFGTLRGAVVESAAGTPRMLILQFEDRTEQQRAEEDLRLLQERLARMNRLGTMGEMAAGIAHEINQPLSAISTYARACRRALENGSFRGDQMSSTLDKISQQAHRASQVIRRVRSLVERRDVERRPSDLLETLREAVALAETEARLLGLHVETEFEAIPMVSIDRIQIQQVLLNLLRNGFEAVESLRGERGLDEISEASREQALVVTCEMGSSGDIVIAVKDRGPGLSPGTAEKIFEPFFSSKEDGMGMGLSICRSIIEAHGGRLGWSPNKGGGAVFHFSLPSSNGESGGGGVG